VGKGLLSQIGWNLEGENSRHFRKSADRPSRMNLGKWKPFAITHWLCSLYQFHECPLGKELQGLSAYVPFLSYFPPFCLSFPYYSAHSTCFLSYSLPSQALCPSRRSSCIATPTVVLQFIDNCGKSRTPIHQFNFTRKHPLVGLIVSIFANKINHR